MDASISCPDPDGTSFESLSSVPQRARTGATGNRPAILNGRSGMGKSILLESG